jgi:predicted phage terminase large subunit-like protein
MCQYPDSNFLYISYSKSLAAKHTEFIKRIMMSRHYNWLFDVELRHDSTAKDLFRTTENGTVAAFGSGGAITGSDAGLPGVDRFSGAVIIDDPIKPDEALSDVVRQSVLDNYSHTIQQRARSQNVPFVFIGQRVHEADLGAHLIAGEDGYEWEQVILKSIDEAGNALYPEAFPLDMLEKRRDTDMYVFASQFQQNPQPAGGSLFKPEWFPRLPEEPEMIATFITADTAETSKSYNDATAFSFWGVYEIETLGHKTGQLGLHWIDAVEIRVEPRELKDAFLAFYMDTLNYKIPPLTAFIEKKSSGVTLISVLQEMRGLSVRDIQRTSQSGSKMQRFLEIQPFVSSRCVSFPEHGKHVTMCVEHMAKITANDSHRHDDLADTAADAVKIALIDKSIGQIHNVFDSNKVKMDALRKSTHKRIYSRR